MRGGEPFSLGMNALAPIPSLAPSLPPIPRGGADESYLLGLMLYTLGSYEQRADVIAEHMGLDVDGETMVDELG